MHILLTNNTLNLRGGTELYVRDLATELLRRGHHPVAYSTKLGPVAEELKAAGVTVTSQLDSLSTPPDLIHGHHHYETLTAILRFPATPAISYCHGWIPWQEAPLRVSSVVRYIAVDEISRERLIDEGGIDPDKIDLVLNFFDGRRFLPREGSPPARRALAFGNPFSEEHDVPVLREACARCGFELEVAGTDSGHVEAVPETRLGQYEIVFAKGRAAIEAMASGAAVILCGYGRLGAMVDPGNFAEMRRNNFGLTALARRLEVQTVVDELKRHQPAGAEAVGRLVWEHCELQPAVDRILALYERVLEEARGCPRPEPAEVCREAARYLERWGPYYTQALDLLPVHARWSALCETMEGRLGVRDYDRLERRLVDAERQSAACRLELEAIRNSVTWRWSRHLLNSTPVRFFLGALIRAKAQPPTGKQTP